MSGFTLVLCCGLAAVKLVSAGPQIDWEKGGYANDGDEQDESIGSWSDRGDWDYSGSGGKGDGGHGNNGWWGNGDGGHGNNGGGDNGDGGHGNNGGGDNGDSGHGNNGWEGNGWWGNGDDDNNGWEGNGWWGDGDGGHGNNGWEGNGWEGNGWWGDGDAGHGNNGWEGNGWWGDGDAGHGNNGWEGNGWWGDGNGGHGNNGWGGNGDGNNGWWGNGDGGDEDIINEGFDPFPWEAVDEFDSWEDTEEDGEVSELAKETNLDNVADRAIALINDCVSEHGEGIMVRPDVHMKDLLMKHGVEIGRNSAFRAGPANITNTEAGVTLRLGIGFHLYAWAYGDIRSTSWYGADSGVSGIFFFEGVEVRVVLTAHHNTKRFGPKFADVFLEDLRLVLNGRVSLVASDPARSGEPPKSFAERIVRKTNREIERLKPYIERNAYHALSEHQPFNWLNSHHLAKLIAAL